VLVYAVVDDSLSRHLLGDSIDVFVRREAAERFIDDVRGDDPELAKPLRIEERELEVGGRNGDRPGRFTCTLGGVTCPERHRQSG
jgi:hypothetical protein